VKYDISLPMKKAGKMDMASTPVRPFAMKMKLLGSGLSEYMNVEMKSSSSFLRKNLSISSARSFIPLVKNLRKNPL
jgi:hypothetical protein